MVPGTHRALFKGFLTIFSLPLILSRHLVPAPDVSGSCFLLGKLKPTEAVMPGVCGWGDGGLCKAASWEAEPGISWGRGLRFPGPAQPCPLVPFLCGAGHMTGVHREAPTSLAG